MHAFSGHAPLLGPRHASRGCVSGRGGRQRGRGARVRRPAGPPTHPVPGRAPLLRSRHPSTGSASRRGVRRPLLLCGSAEAGRRALGTLHRRRATALSRPSTSGPVTCIESRSMTGARARIIGALARLRLGRRRGGSTDALLSMLPDSALVPLQRDGLDPVPELGQLRAAEPVSRMKLPFGLRAWLVTGYEETKAVLAAGPAFSNDFTNLVGTVGITAEQNPGGLGFTDPPDHTRLRKLLTPEFTGHRLRRLAPRIEGIVAGQLDEMATQRRRAPSTSSRASRCRSRRSRSASCSGCPTPIAPSSSACPPPGSTCSVGSPVPSARSPSPWSTC